MQLRLMNIDLRYNYKKASYLWCSNNNLRYSPGNRAVVNVQVKIFVTQLQSLIETKNFY